MERVEEGSCLLTQMLVFAWLSWSIQYSVFMKGRDPSLERERELKKKEWMGITKSMLVCMCTTNAPHWPDKLCSLQKRDFSEMRGSKSRD